MNKQELIRHNRRKIAQLKKMGELSEHCKADLESAEIALAALEAEPVDLPKVERLDGDGYGYYFDMNDVFVALDAAGISYKVNLE